MLAARVRSMVAKGACMQTFENDLFWLLKEIGNMQFWGTKSALCPPRAVQILLAVAERAAMAPLGGEFCVQSVPPFVLLLFNAPFLITFFRKMLLARAGSTFLHNDCKRSALANPLF